MTATSSAASFGFASVVTGPRRVFVRDASGKHPGLAVGFMGTETHRRMLGAWTSAVTVKLDRGVTLECPPDWVHPARDLAAELSIPTLPPRA